MYIVRATANTRGTLRWHDALIRAQHERSMCFCFQPCDSLDFQKDPNSQTCHTRPILFTKISTNLWKVRSVKLALDRLCTGCRPSTFLEIVQYGNPYQNLRPGVGHRYFKVRSLSYLGSNLSSTLRLSFPLRRPSSVAPICARTLVWLGPVFDVHVLLISNHS